MRAGKKPERRRRPGRWVSGQGGGPRGAAEGAGSRRRRPVWGGGVPRGGDSVAGRRGGSLAPSAPRLPGTGDTPVVGPPPGCWAGRERGGALPASPHAARRGGEGGPPGGPKVALGGSPGWP